MPDIVQCGSGEDVVKAVDDYLVNLGADLKNSEQATQARHIKSGMPSLFRPSSMAFFYVRDENKVKGVIRLKISSDSIHIENLTAIPRSGAGRLLVLQAKSFAVAKGKGTVDLDTAEASLVTYYQGLGFALVNPQAQTGEMRAPAQG